MPELPEVEIARRNLVHWLDGHRVVRAEADGGVLDYYAQGGVRENHVAQIAKAGDWRVWAEDETGGEAYIPLAPSKRKRSVDIWEETGKRLGVQGFANGAVLGVGTEALTAALVGQMPGGLSDAAGAVAAPQAAAAIAAKMEPSGGGSATGLLPIMAEARQYVMDVYGLRNIGGFAKRNIAGTNKLSDHALGKAIDIMTSNLALGTTIARDFAFGPAHDRFQAENVIWQQAISSRGGAFRGMADRGSPTQNHRDHVHVDTYAKGGIRNPHVRDAGGPLEPGYTYNGTGRREVVLPVPPGYGMDGVTDGRGPRGRGGAGTVVDVGGITLVNSRATPRELVRELSWSL